MTSLSEYYDLLERADWSYSMSDDHSVWKRGQAEFARLQSIAKEGGKEYLDLYDKMKAYFWSEPVYENGVYIGRRLPKPPKPN